MGAGLRSRRVRVRVAPWSPCLRGSKDERSATNREAGGSTPPGDANAAAARGQLRFIGGSAHGSSPSGGTTRALSSGDGIGPTNRTSRIRSPGRALCGALAGTPGEAHNLVQPGSTPGPATIAELAHAGRGSALKMRSGWVRLPGSAPRSCSPIGRRRRNQSPDSVRSNRTTTTALR